MTPDFYTRLRILENYVKNLKVAGLLLNIRCQMLGMVSWYRKFITNISIIIALLSAQCEEANEKMKTALVSAPILFCQNFNKPFIVQ